MPRQSRQLLRQLHVSSGPPWVPGKIALLIFLDMFFIVGENQAALGDHEGFYAWWWLQRQHKVLDFAWSACCNQTSNMSHVHHQKSAVRYGKSHAIFSKSNGSGDRQKRRLQPT